MDIHDFFDFDSKYSSTTVRAHPVGLDVTTQASELFDHHRLILGNDKWIHFPIIFEQDHGTKLHDILNTGYVSLFLISEKMRDILEENNLTGWKTFPITLLDKQKKEILGYYGFSITGRCGPIDYSKSQIMQKRFIENGPLWNFYKGLHIDLDKWDGCDFFLPEGNFGIKITAKTADILKKNKISNVFLENLVDVETDESTVKLEEKRKCFNQNTE